MSGEAQLRTKVPRGHRMLRVTHYRYSLQVEDGWCEGTNKNGERGMFPDNFVQMRPASKQQTQQPEETTPLSTPLSTPKPATPTVVTRESGMYGVQ